MTTEYFSNIGNTIYSNASEIAKYLYDNGAAATGKIYQYGKDFIPDEVSSRASIVYNAAAPILKAIPADRYVFAASVILSSSFLIKATRSNDKLSNTQKAIYISTALTMIGCFLYQSYLLGAMVGENIKASA